MGLPWAYQSPVYLTVSLPELIELESPRLVVPLRPLIGMAVDLLPTKTAMNLSQLISGPFHLVGHMLEFRLCCGQANGELKVRVIISTTKCHSPIPFWWVFGYQQLLTSAVRGGGTYQKHPSQRLVNPAVLAALGDFPEEKDDTHVKPLASFWHKETMKL